MKQEYLDFLINEVKLKPRWENKTSNEVQPIKCLICGNNFKAGVKGKVNNYRKHGFPGCSSCTKLARYKEIRKENLNFLLIKFYIDDTNKEKILNGPRKEMVKVLNKNCGHEFRAKLGNLLSRDVNCPTCNTEAKRQQFINYNEERHQESLSRKQGYQQYKQLVYKLTRDNYKKYKKQINPKNYKRVLAGSEEGYHLDHIVSVRFCFDKDIPEHICAHPDNLRMVKWQTNVRKYKKPVIKYPHVFSPYIDNLTSTFVEEIKDMMDCSKFEFFKEFEQYQLTMYSSKYNFAIYFVEFSSHVEQIISSKSHFRKMKEYFEDKGVKLIILYEDEWMNNRDLVVEKIKHYMGINKHKKVFARKCIIKEIDKSESVDFLNKNHIQGSCGSQIKLGAYYDNTLVAVMTFTKPRIAMMHSKKKVKENSWELARFATDVNYRVIGIASKLLKHFQKNYKWNIIYSYADLRWSSKEKNVYESLGFSLDKINPQEYHYIVENKRFHRWGFRKDALKEKFPEYYDKTQTEYQNILNIGYDRIWDSGTLKYIMEK